MNNSISERIHISERIQEEASKCKKKLACLKEKCELCAVADCVNDSVLFVKSEYNASCPYQQMFGNEFICSCPVRKEIYEKYRL